jgi:hypothetical protein
MMHQKPESQLPFLIAGHLTQWVSNTPHAMFRVDRLIWPNHRWSWMAHGALIADGRTIGPVFGKDAIEVARILHLRETDGKLIRFNGNSYTATVD